MRLPTMMRLVIEDMGQRWRKRLVREMITSAEVRLIERSCDSGITQFSDNTLDADVFGFPGSPKICEIFKEHRVKRSWRISRTLNPLKPNPVTHKNMVQRIVQGAEKGTHILAIVGI